MCRTIATLLVIAGSVCNGQLIPSGPKTQTDNTAADTRLKAGQLENIKVDTELKRALKQKTDSEALVAAIDAKIATLFTGPMVDKIVGPTMGMAAVKQEAMTSLKLLLLDDEQPVEVTIGRVSAILNSLKSILLPGQEQKQQLQSLRSSVFEFLAEWSPKPFSAEKKNALAKLNKSIDQHFNRFGTRGGLIATDFMTIMMGEADKVMSAAMAGLDTPGGLFEGMSKLYPSRSDTEAQPEIKQADPEIARRLARLLKEDRWARDQQVLGTMVYLEGRIRPFLRPSETIALGQELRKNIEDLVIRSRRVQSKSNDLVLSVCEELLALSDGELPATLALLRDISNGTTQ